MKTSDYLLQATNIVPVEYITPRDRPDIERNVREKLFNIASRLAAERFVTQTDERGMREYKFQAYVIPAVDFWQIVREEAMRMGYVTTVSP